MNTLPEQLQQFARLNEYVNEPTIELVFGHVAVNKENMTKILTILAENKVRQFVLAETSSALMDELEAFTEAGCRMVGMKKFSYTVHWGDWSDTREIKGVELAF